MCFMAACSMSTISDLLSCLISKISGNSREGGLIMMDSSNDNSDNNDSGKKSSSSSSSSSRSNKSDKTDTNNSDSNSSERNSVRISNSNKKNNTKYPLIRHLVALGCVIVSGLCTFSRTTSNFKNFSGKWLGFKVSLVVLFC
jgi:ABC-type antimicrobial peptide transport system permease subunit